MQPLVSVRMAALMQQFAIVAAPSLMQVQVSSHGRADTAVCCQRGRGDDHEQLHQRGHAHTEQIDVGMDNLAKHFRADVAVVQPYGNSFKISSSSQVYAHAVFVCYSSSQLFPSR
jgi:hypothetical protein